jgi:nucleoside triphosphate diphosphatase
MSKPVQPLDSIEQLLEIMRALRDPDSGCPWDVAQSFETIVPYTIEEAYEVADAIERGDMADLADELGDLLLQVVFHAQMASEAGLFTFSDVVGKINAKMIRRHPHVFGDAEARSVGAVKGMWEDIKAAEKQGRKGDTPQAPYLDEVPRALPALMRAIKLQNRAKRVGFDWDDVSPVFDKIRDEIDELEAATRQLGSSDQARQDQEAELGDVLFAITNLARHLGHDPEVALTNSNNKFVRRFNFIEKRLAAEGKTLQETSLERMEELWDASKRESR